MGKLIPIIIKHYRNLTLLHQLYASLRSWLRPPSTPPYLLFTFYTITLVSSFVGILFYASFPDKDLGQLSLNIVHFIVASILIYYIGTLPVNDVLPGGRVATRRDVSTT